MSYTQHRYRKRERERERGKERELGERKGISRLWKEDRKEKQEKR
jgi:hypothetical protein